MACTATTRAGKPCKSPPIKGTDRCLSHSPAKARESVGFVARNGKAGRKPLPRPTDVARELIEQHVLTVLAPHFRTLGYDITLQGDGLHLVERERGGAKVHATYEGSVYVSEHDDLGAMIAAAEKLLDRIYGKPRQDVNLGGELPIHMEVMGASIVSDPHARKAAGELRRRVGAARAVKSGRARSSH